MITESQLEQLALSWFQEIGWAHASLVPGPARDDSPGQAQPEIAFKALV